MMSDAGQGAEVNISITPELGAFVRLVGIRVTDFSVVIREPSLDEPLAEAATALRATDGHDDVTMAVRGLYRRLGIDPTKRRPSSEALLRRVRRGEPLPRVNALVDVCNWCSVESRLPFGLYDADQIHGVIECRRGRQGEAYSGIRKDDVNVDGRLVLSDQTGAFGNPSSDSVRTMITSSTTSAMVVVFAPLDVDSRIVASTVDTVTARVMQFIGPRAIMSWAARKQLEAK
tara:strand:- start:3909 stop:4601 length:693 start_codon:yes stop_codon:yes gene_type:complete